MGIVKRVLLPLLATGVVTSAGAATFTASVDGSANQYNLTAQITPGTQELAASHQFYIAVAIGADAYFLAPSG